MRIRSRIIIFVLIIIILFLGSRAEFLGSGDALLFFISNNKFVILEDPEPNYYFINNKNLGISFEDPELDCRVRIRIIILLIIISLLILRIRSRIIILLKKIIFILTMLGS